MDDNKEDTRRGVHTVELTNGQLKTAYKALVYCLDTLHRRVISHPEINLSPIKKEIKQIESVIKEIKELV